MAMTKNDIHVLRELAKRQAEIAALPHMEERRRWWYDLNDGKTTQPLCIFAFHGPHDGFYMPMRCETPLAREVEHNMIIHQTTHMLVDDDRVFEPYIRLRARNGFTPFGTSVGRSGTQYADGGTSIGYAYHHPVQDFAADIEKFTKSTWRVDYSLLQTLADCAEVRAAIGDIIGVRAEVPSICFYPASWVLEMMGMENMMVAMMDEPELFHSVMRKLTDDMHEYLDALEIQGGLLLNSDSTFLNQDSWGYTSQLPKFNYDGVPRLRHMWGYSNAQETVGMSPEMFDEFFFQYIKEFADRMGLFAYGCCEPVDSQWPLSLSRLPNLRKLSVSPWCNEEALGEMIRGKGIVYHRKPSPNFVGVDEHFDEDAFAAHMKRTALAASGSPLEVTFRDILTLRGEPWRAKRAVEITREAFAKYYQS